MKLGAFLLLVSLVTLGLEVQEVQTAVRPLQLLGTCAELCNGDWDCAPGEQCVSIGCSSNCVTN
ncbi:protein Wfdc21-like [Apodemus sylvaticus]|uniref:protein Wfdc21-like n=1 Tax=Apodemus sylvaticus TaxID=10129 RepID=UPI002241B9F7|nr:protein Wfdc21-like [Apodemus sylvaticus]